MMDFIIYLTFKHQDLIVNYAESPATDDSDNDDSDDITTSISHSQTRSPSYRARNRNRYARNFVSLKFH